MEISATAHADQRYTRWRRACTCQVAVELGVIAKLGLASLSLLKRERSVVMTFSLSMPFPVAAAPEVRLRRHHLSFLCSGFLAKYRQLAEPLQLRRPFRVRNCLPTRQFERTRYVT